ncbi:MAG: hypothetical protein M1508_12245, partial [Nitrospirae bacterium]|nr:hypothetical protein [Nitrospirota bacterium]
MIRPKNTLVTNFIGIMLLILIVGQGILYTWLLLYQKVYLEKRLMDQEIRKLIMEATAYKFKSEGLRILQISDDIPEFNICYNPA